MSGSQPVFPDFRLFFPIFCRMKDFLHPPFIAGCRGQHTSHQMKASVRMRKRMERVSCIHTEVSARYKNSPGCSEREVTPSLSNYAAADSSSGIIPGSSHDLYGLRKSQCLRRFLSKGSHHLPAFKKLRQLPFRNPADLHHFPAPAFMPDIQQQHTGSIRIIRTVYAGQPVIDVILGKHDFGNLPEQLRLMLFHPEQLGGCKSGKGDIAR